MSNTTKEEVKRMMNKKMITLIGVAALMASIVTMNTQSAQHLVQAQQEEDRGLVDNFGQGRRDGIKDGASDYREGFASSAYCPGGGLDYCAGYAIGYNDGFESARKV